MSVYLLKEDFENLPEIKTWMDAKGDNPKIKSHVNRMYVFCKTLGIEPKDIISSDNHLQYLANLVTMFKTHLKLGTVEYTRPAFAKSVERNPDSAHKDYVKSIQSFLSVFGKGIPPRYATKGSVLDRSQVMAGAYADTMINDKQFSIGLEYMKQFEIKYQAIFAMMFEIMARPESLFSWVNNIQFKQTTIEHRVVQYAEIPQFYESKTNSKWNKLILDPRVISIVKELPKNQRLFSSNVAGKQAEINEILREFYQKIRLFSVPNPPNNIQVYTDDWYLWNRPTYTLRHSGAHGWCRRCDYRYEKVGAMGWDDVNTLKKYYAKMPSHNLLDDAVCYQCTPPNDINTDNLYFCRFSHALLWLNNRYC